jgi:hypothetical protein
MRRNLQILALVLTSLHAPLAAQGSTADSVTPPRVRVRQVGVERPVIGSVTHLGPDTLYLSAAEGDLAIARSEVTRLEVSRGMRSNADRGFKTGLITGATLGLAAGIAIVAHPAGCFCDTGPETVPEMMAIFGLPGAVLGAAIGALSHSEQWRKAQLDDQAISLRLVPRQGQMAVELGMGMKF